ncbi:hypothetical protein ZWY2020_035160 [Hordeum vulgare]|nr:hypothetical protein ZWY2020_035146 [Hordeum vulgare]KAI4995257.1 hypothetical protein ZWY2020_035160 [Hordeum vulgare]
MEEKNLEQQQLGTMEEEKNLEQQHLGAMEEEKNVEQQQLGAMEEEKNVEQQHLGAMEEEKNVEQQRQQHGAMGEKVYSMDNKVLELPYVPIHELDVAFSVEVVPDDVPLVNPDAETQDTRELLLSGIWKKKVGSMNVGVQVGGDDVNVTKQEVARGNNVVDAVKKSKWDDIDDPKKNPIVGEMLHLHSPEYFNVDGSIKPPKNDIVGKED